VSVIALENVAGVRRVKFSKTSAVCATLLRVHRGKVKRASSLKHTHPIFTATSTKPLTYLFIRHNTPGAHTAHFRQTTRNRDGDRERSVLRL